MRYHGLDRRAAAPVVESLDVPRVTTLLAALSVAALELPLVVGHSTVAVLGHTIGAASCLAVLAGVAMFIQWRIDGRAEAWWLAVGYSIIGVPGMAQSQWGGQASLHLAVFAVALGFFVAAWRTTEVDSWLSATRFGVALGLGLAAIVLADAGLRSPILTRSIALCVGCGYLCLAVAWRRSLRIRASFVVPLAGFAMCCAVLTIVADAASRAAAIGSIECFVNAIAAASALAGLQGAATRQRSLALDARRESELLDSRRRELEKRYADTMDEIFASASVLQGRIDVAPAEADTGNSRAADDPLGRSIVAEVKRLRAMAEADRRVRTEFRLAEALEPPLALWRANGWAVHAEIDDTVFVRGRLSDVTQIVHGLLSNAQKYAPGEPLEVTTRLTARFVLVLVDDGGPGVPAAHRERIFERGERPAHAQASEGQGLGLHIGRQLARALGGELWVEQNPRRGARFVLALPLPQTPGAGGTAFPLKAAS